MILVLFGPRIYEFSNCIVTLFQAKEPSVYVHFMPNAHLAFSARSAKASARCPCGDCATPPSTSHGRMRPAPFSAQRPHEKGDMGRIRAL